MFYNQAGITMKNITKPLLTCIFFFVFLHAGNQCHYIFPLPAFNSLVIPIPMFSEPPIESDIDCDGIIDRLDNDIDGDGIPNSADPDPYIPNQEETESHDMENDHIGHRVLLPLKADTGSIFVSVAGSGEQCTLTMPCAIDTAVSRMRAGDVHFLRGGSYRRIRSLRLNNSGSASAPIVIAAYPGEHVVIEGPFTTLEYTNAHRDERFNGIVINGNYIHMRDIEVRYMGYSGITVNGSYNMIEGCRIHDNRLSGVTLYGGEWHDEREGYRIPYGRGYNTVQDNVIYHNSDAGLEADGNNADGIWVGSGEFNRVLHNTVYHNSDDGIDTWRSNDTYVGYNRVYGNGIAEGDGNGIKAGGNWDKEKREPDFEAGNGRRVYVEHNMAYSNRANGIDYNVGIDTRFVYNTSFGNGGFGFTGSGLTRTVMRHNIAASNTRGPTRSQWGEFNSSQNSWDNPHDEVRFQSTDPNSSDFLNIVQDSAFAGSGAFGTDYPPKPMFLIGDSTVHNADFPDNEGGFWERGWGDMLWETMRDPALLSNEARSGASSLSYKNVSNTRHDWEETKEKMRSIHLNKGAYLLIQFGHNDVDEDPALHTEPGEGDSFYNELKEYIDEARAMGVTPVLITPVERLHKGRHHHTRYAQTMRELAANEGVLLLDLTQKSFEEFDKYNSDEDLYNVFAYDDHTHFNPNGARIVASWVVDLACTSDDEALCRQFKR
jgi:parallel beta-helix repeat protein